MKAPSNGPRRRRGAPRPQAQPKQEATPRNSAGERRVHAADKSFPIVGIGASAGGVEALTELLTYLGTDTGMAFVVIQHFPPKHESILAELLSRKTTLPVQEAGDRKALEPNHVYVIPTDSDATISNGVLHLAPRETTRSGQRMPIDHFLASLAQDRGKKAIGVILSGIASDGTLGLKAIKAADGVTFAQDERSAKHPGMPLSAVATGCVDFVMPPQSIAKELGRIGRHPYIALHQAEMEEFHPRETSQLRRVYGLLRNTCGVDFTSYRQTTIKRRVRRRMFLHRLERLRDYVKFLLERPAEVEALFQDILIHVTGFFRETEAFDVLRNKVFPALLRGRRPDVPMRIWVPGCSTGEEVYSIAICLLEALSPSSGQQQVQIFATDIGPLDKARRGWYPESIIAEVSPDRLSRFFLKAEQGYEIIKSIREVCIFARHNVLTDPPFSKLDLISCRNLLIYLEAALQKRVLSTFQYALKPTGFLMLGSSESVSGFQDYFEPVDKKQNIYVKRSGVAELAFDFGRPRQQLEREPSPPRRVVEDVGKQLDLRKAVDRLVVSRYAPPAVVVNEALEILEFRGDAGRYLQLPSGQPTMSLAKMARKGLLFYLRQALQQAKTEGGAVTRERVHMEGNQGFASVDLEVVPITGHPARGCLFLVAFRESSAPAAKGRNKEVSAGAPYRRSAVARDLEAQLLHLREELAQARSHLQTTIEEQEGTNEELRASHEEVLSANEELQSTNEELETAKEELQSGYEELTTLNDELRNRNLELSRANSDLSNLLSSIQVPIVMLSNDLRIRHFTPIAGKVFNLIPADIGRPISNIKPSFDLPKLEELVLEAIDSAAIKEVDVQDRLGHWYSMRIRPYKTLENKVEGAVITLIDISRLKASAELADIHAQAVFDTARESLLVLDQQLWVKSANRTFYHTFKLLPGDVLNQSIYTVGNGQWDIPQLRTLLEEVLPQDKMFEGIEVEHHFPVLGFRKMLLDARKLEVNDRASLIVLGIEDVTERYRTQEALADSGKRYRLLLERNLAGVYYASLEGQILECNQAFAQILGYPSRDELLLVRAPQLFADPADFDGLQAQLREKKAVSNNYCQFRRKDGILIDVLTNCCLVESKGDAPPVIEGFVVDVSEHKRAEAALRQLSGRLVQLQDEERQRLSRDLHDTAGPTLTALIMNLARIEKSAANLDKGARESLAESLALAKQCAQELRTVSYLLRPPLLDEVGLTAALRWYVDGFADRSGIRVDLEMPDVGRLSQDVEITLFRIVQESLTNIHRHAQTEQAWIRVARSNDEVMLEVKDEGKGLPADILQSAGEPLSVLGLGIAGMRERVRQLGGRLEIKSGERGTRLEARLPCSPAGAEGQFTGLA